MSNQQTIGDLREIRVQASLANQQLVTLNRLAKTGNLNLYDLAIITRSLSGGNEDLESLIGYVQTVITAVTAARTALKLLQLEMGPLGWILLALGTAATVIGVDQLLRRPR